MIDETGCDAVMIGRAALVNPFIFKEINYYLETGKIVGTFGINGELKVLSDATTNRFVKGNFLYLGKNTKRLEIRGYYGGYIYEKKKSKT